MNLLLSSGVLYKKPPQVVAELARRVGFDGIELVIGYGFQNVSGEREIEAILKRGPIGGIHAPFYRLRGWGHPFDALLHTIDLAEKYRIPLVTFHPPRWFDLEFGFYRRLKAIRDFQERFGNRFLTIAIENMPVRPGIPRIGPYFLQSPASLLKFADKHNLALTLDLTHLGTLEKDFFGTFRAFMSTRRVRNIHFSDYKNGQEHLFPGRGALPLIEILETLKQTHYNGAVTLEIFPREIEGDFKEMMRRLFTALEFITSRIGDLREPHPKEAAHGI